MRDNQGSYYIASPEVRLLKAMANSQRLVILQLLARHPEGLTASELMIHTGLGQSALSQHLGRLRDASLVARSRQPGKLSFKLSSPLVLPLLEVLARSQRVRSAPDVVT